MQNSVQNPEIVIIGAAIIDVLARPVSTSVFETGSYPVEDIHMTTGADALNEATILAKKGRKVQLETVIGRDEAGKFIQNHCERTGIIARPECIREDERTGMNIVLVEEDGTRSFLTNPHGTLRSLQMDYIQMPFPESAKIICFASIFVFPKIGPDELEQIFSEAKAQGKNVCADMTKRKNDETLEDMAEAFSYIDYLFPNEEEAKLLTGAGTVEEAAALIKSAGVRNVIIKGGNRGCYIQTDVEKYWVDAEKDVECIDTTGAGDSFVAGFLNALLDGKTMEECARDGNSYGAKSVQYVGATEWLKYEK